MATAVKTVWITDASSGIGAALARAYSGRSFRVILSGRNEAALAAVAAQCATPSLLLPFEAADFAAATAATKHGLIDYADALRVELNQTGIDVFAVMTGSVRTDV